MQELEFDTIVVMAHKASSGDSVTPPSEAVNEFACTSLNSALAAGIPNRDVLFYSCPTCETSAETQLFNTVSYLNDNCPSAWSGKIWLAVGYEWKYDKWPYKTSYNATNRNFYENLIATCNSTSKFTCGVYTNATYWKGYLGSTDYCVGFDLPLWYVSYNGVKDFSDYQMFGCWAMPSAKSYGGGSRCNMSVELNYFPNY